MKPTLEISNLSIGYDNRPMVDEINISSKTNGLITLIGRNGKGKSTLLKTLAGLLPTINGEVFFNGQNNNLITDKERAKLLSLVLSNPIEIGNILVSSFVAYGRYPYSNWLGINTPYDTKKVNEAIELCDIAKLKNRYYNELSDGEKQKVNIARVIAQDTPFLILDEPTAHLDLVNKVEILKLLKELAHHQNKTIIISTHQIEIALQLSDEIWLLSDSQLTTTTTTDLIKDNQLNDLFGDENIKFNPTNLSFDIL